MRTSDPIAELPHAKRLGDGVIQGALLKALAAAGGPMGVGEAQTAVETLLGHGVSSLPCSLPCF
jgi:hypothetical protein